MLRVAKVAFLTECNDPTNALLYNKTLYGLIVSVRKTKYMKCTRRQDQLTTIIIENK
jgi:hypothetical protein